jgi:glycosyltransferase involved in cell wall biosynthesis
MRVLLVHNAYQQRGGEDSVVESEAALLRQRGHDVQVLLRHNDEVNELSRLSLAAQTLWSNKTVAQLNAQMARVRPDVIHVHNTLPLVSPSVFWAATRARVPVVQTLHNFRLLCPQATLLREGRVCEDCIGRLPWPAVIHRCYRGSGAQTAAVALMLSAHRGMGTWRNKVSRFIALTQFGKAKFVQGGLNPQQIDIKPNFIDWVPTPQWAERQGGLYIGRLSVEKGIEVLMQAMRDLPQHRLTVIGSGPYENAMQELAGPAFLGAKALPEVLARLGAASYLVLPSVCYEGFPRTLVEAFACGVPVIASRHGALEELVDDGRTGLLFSPGDATDLVDKIRWADANPLCMQTMGRAARAEYELHYTPERNGQQLEEIYRRAMAESASC